MRGLVRSKKILSDLDGVVWNYVAAHLKLLEEISGRKLPERSASWPNEWNYHKTLGLAPEVLNEAHKRIQEDPLFWTKLQLEEGALQYISQLVWSQSLGHEIYFVTARQGVAVKFQTELSLLKWFTNPTVLIAPSMDKSLIVKGLDADIFIDDNRDTAEGAAMVGKKGLVVLLPDRPWNQGPLIEGVVRVENLAKALALLTQGEEK